jgi:hypothetical protein
MDVGARDQDHDGDGREQRQQRRPDARDDAFLQADDFGRFVRAVLGILHRQAFGDGLDLGAGLRQRDPWLQPCDDDEKMSATSRVGRERQGAPELGLRHERERRRHHAVHGHWRAVERHVSRRM